MKFKSYSFGLAALAVVGLFAPRINTWVQWKLAMRESMRSAMADAIDPKNQYKLYNNRNGFFVPTNAQGLIGAANIRFLPNEQRIKITIITAKPGDIDKKAYPSIDNARLDYFALLNLPEGKTHTNIGSIYTSPAPRHALMRGGFGFIP